MQTIKASNATAHFTFALMMAGASGRNVGNIFFVKRLVQRDSYNIVQPAERPPLHLYQHYSSSCAHTHTRHENVPEEYTMSLW